MGRGARATGQVTIQNVMQHLQKASGIETFPHCLDAICVSSNALIDCASVVMIIPALNQG